MLHSFNCSSTNKAYIHEKNRSLFLKIITLKILYPLLFLDEKLIFFVSSLLENTFTYLQAFVEIHSILQLGRTKV